MFLKNVLLLVGVSIMSRLIGILVTASSLLSRDVVAANITLVPKDPKVFDKSTVGFVCEVSGYRTPEFRWNWNGTRLTKDGRYFILNRPYASVLRIKSVRWNRDNGTIECMVEDGDDSLNASTSLEVYVNGKGSVPLGYPKIRKSPPLKAVDEHKNTTMVCNATGDPHPSITWLKDRFPVDTTDPRFSVLPTGSLQIQNSLASDEGEYECVAENSVGVAYSGGTNLYVRAALRTPPHFSVLSGSISVKPGGAANLTCAAVGSPMPHVWWRKGTEELTPDGEAPASARTLTLTDIRESASYRCFASSKEGMIESDVEVKVEEPPHFSITPESVTVRPGDPVNLTCAAVGSPLPSVWWKESGRELALGSDVPTGRNVLTLTEVRKSAVYTCVASSELGIIEFDAQVRVDGSSRVKDSDLTNYAIDSGVARIGATAIFALVLSFVVN